VKEKLIGRWHCYSWLHDGEHIMTYVFNADGTYEYENRRSGMYSKANYTLDGNMFRRVGSTSTEIDFREGKLLMYLGEGSNAMWYEFTRQ